MTVRQGAQTGIAAGAAFAVGILISVLLNTMQSPSVTVPLVDPTGGSTLAAAEGLEGEIVFAYFGSSGCAWSGREELISAVEESMRRVAAWAVDNDLQFLSVGVALDTSTERGLDYLSHFSGFDQVATGGGWHNELARYGFGVDELPQLVILKRGLEAQAIDGRWGRSDLIARKVGLFEIERWSRQGAPLPSASPPSDDGR